MVVKSRVSGPADGRLGLAQEQAEISESSNAEPTRDKSLAGSQSGGLSASAEQEEEVQQKLTGLWFGRFDIYRRGFEDNWRLGAAG